MTDNEGTAMPIDKRKFMDWNLNTILGGVTLITMIAGGAIAWNNYQRDIGELQAWRAQAQAAATAGAHQRSAVDAQRAGRFYAP